MQINRLIQIHKPMKLSIETRFNPGDKVWRKNLVTNEAEQVEIVRVDVLVSFIEGGQSYVEIYHSEDADAGMCNIPGQVDANNAFATKEDADACPAYVPKTTTL